MKYKLLSAAGMYNMINPGDSVLIALSGGADSVALCRLLAGIDNIRISAAHLNHMLRGEESDRDERFVADFCGSLNIPLYCERCDVNGERLRGESVETAARRLRYGYLFKTALQNGIKIIATAHNADDLAETILLNLARGSGGAGLCGIPPIRETNGLRIIRPLLHTSRSEIEEFLSSVGQTYVTDSSNLSDDYTRNRLRHSIIPEMKQINRRFIEHAAFASSQLISDNSYLESVAREFVDEKNSKITISDVLRQPLPISSRVFRLLCGINGFAPEKTHMDMLNGICRGSNPSAKVSLRSGLIAQRRYDELFIFKERERKASGAVKLVPGENIFCGYLICVGKKDTMSGHSPSEITIGSEYANHLYVRSRKQGDKITPIDRSWTKSLKKLFIEMKIPKEERDFYPVIVYEDAVCAVPGVGADKKFHSCGEDLLSIAVSKLM
jgi:tRNA(Ile)-lysidine synthase